MNWNKLRLEIPFYGIPIMLFIVSQFMDDAHVIRYTYLFVCMSFMHVMKRLISIEVNTEYDSAFAALHRVRLELEQLINKMNKNKDK